MKLRGIIHKQMNQITKANSLVIVLFSLLVVQSCATIRTHIDENCVAVFASEYPLPQDSRFILPWQVGESYQLTQGNCTSESHSVSAKQHMAFDFKMPIGTTLVAVDAGRVFAVVEQFKDGTDDRADETNFIGIEHKGGFLSWYAHLTLNGALVKVGDQVSQGDVIGSSGDTGNSAYPHLHFYVQQLNSECHDAETKTADFALCPQVPVSFSNASPGHAVLEEWVSYTALPYSASP